jgi:hypothetical protein
LKLSDDARLVPVSRVAVREIQDGAVLVHTATGQCFELNRIGIEIWQALGRGQSLRQIHDVLADRYPVAREKLAADLANLTDALLAAGLVEVALPDR